jgi:ferredoxin
MKIVVNLDTCDTHGDCVVEAPEIFDLEDDDDYVRVLLSEPGEDLRDAAQRAADACPVSAITIED